MNKAYSDIITRQDARDIAKVVNNAYRHGKPVVTEETVFRVAAGDYLESHPIDCAILSELRKL